MRQTTSKAPLRLLISVLLPLATFLVTNASAAGVLSDCAKLLTPRPEGTKVWLPSNDILKMFRHFSVSEGLRTAESDMLVFKYKNEQENTSPIILDLEDPKLMDDSPALVRVSNFYRRMVLVDWE